MSFFDRCFAESCRCSRCSRRTYRRRRRLRPAVVRALAVFLSLAALTLLLLIAPHWLLVIAVLLLISALCLCVRR